MTDRLRIRIPGSGGYTMTEGFNFLAICNSLLRELNFVREIKSLKGVTVFTSPEHCVTHLEIGWQISSKNAKTCV